MKRILTVFIALALIGIHSPAFAGGWESGKWASPKWSDGAWAGEATTNLSVAKSIPGLTFFADYAEDTLTAGYASGSDVATFAASRSASNPATYIDADGVLQLTTTSNVGRFTKGYYDTTGFHSREGVLIEGAATNYMRDSMFSEAIWTSSWGTITDTTSEVINIPGAKDRNIAFTFVGNELDWTSVLYQATDVDSFDVSAGNITFSVSFWAKGDVSGITSGLGNTAFLSADGVDNANGWVEAGQQTFLNNAMVANLSPTVWKRFNVSATLSNANTRRIQLRFMKLANVNKPSAGENFDLSFTGVQIEKTSYATSFIPTTAAALTRNAESLKGEIANNRTAATESMFMKFSPEYADGTANGKYLMDTDTKRRIAYFNSGGDDIFVFPNINDSGGSSTVNLINEAWSANTEMAIGYSMQATGDPNQSCYYQGVADGTDSNTDFIEPAWDTYFWIGSTTSPNEQLNGIIQWIGFWNRPLTATEHLKLYTDMD